MLEYLSVAFRPFMARPDQTILLLMLSGTINKIGTAWGAT